MTSARTSTRPVGLVRRLAFGMGLLVLAAALATAGPVYAEEVLKPAAAEKVPTAFEKANPEDLADFKEMQEHVEKLVKKVTPAVVGIQIGGASGSGVIVSKDGYVLTAGHVSGRPDRECTVIMPDGKRLKAKSLGNNTGIDSGLIKITEEGEYPYLETARSADLKRGQWVLALGHPKGFDRERRPVVRLGRVLQNSDRVVTTDCALVGGDSGGPLFDMNGNVVAIHSRIGFTMAMNMHVPVDSYRDTWERLAKGETFNDRATVPASGEAFLGVRKDEEASDCRLKRIDPNSPAEKAGLKEGDVIRKFGDAVIKNFDELREHVGKRKPGDKVVLEVERDGMMMKIEVTLGKRES